MAEARADISTLSDYVYQRTQGRLAGLTGTGTTATRHDLTRLAWLLRDLPAEVLGRLRSDRVTYFPAPPRLPGTNGRPVRHGAALKLADPKTWPAAAVSTATETTRYGTARATAWARLHQRLASRAGGDDH